MPSFQNPLVAKVEQLIRAPRSRVFAAFTQPRELKKFWLARASGPLEPGKTIQWHFMVRGANDHVRVVELTPDERIGVEWSNRTRTTWTFTASGRNQTTVTIEQTGFTGEGDAVMGEVMETVQGFAYVLSDLKVLLEHRMRSGIVKDKAMLIERAMRAEKRAQ